MCAATCRDCDAGTKLLVVVFVYKAASGKLVDTIYLFSNLELLIMHGLDCLNVVASLSCDSVFLNVLLQ